MGKLYERGWKEIKWARSTGGTPPGGWVLPYVHWGMAKASGEPAMVQEDQVQAERTMALQVEWERGSRQLQERHLGGRTERW